MSFQKIIKKNVRPNAFATNDNNIYAFSDLESAQKIHLKRRLSDLAWQIKFFDPTSPKWADVESNNWTAIYDLHERAKKELGLLLDQEKGRVKKIKKVL